MKYFAILKGFAVLAVILLLIISRYGSRKSSLPKEETVSEIAKLRGQVTRIRKAEGKAFLEVASSRGENFWVAIPERPLEVGAKIAFELSVPQYNYTAKSLGQVLPLVYFTSHLIVEET